MVSNSISIYQSVISLYFLPQKGNSINSTTALVAEEIVRVSLGVVSICNMQSEIYAMTILSWGAEEKRGNTFRG
ncbi:MAG: acyl-CoA dehydrogenase family protein [Deltaproteobacteria bacterium]|nr:MAG: acyl-CoA dehydrogenase family protein [Deltaproteobacteria bacterium]